MNSTSKPPPESGTQSKPNDSQWYQEDVTSIPPEARQLLEQYGNIAPDRVLPHVLALRDKAFAIRPYACIGQLRFLSFNLSSHPAYPTILSRLQHGATFLDAGCCFAQELRYLVHTAHIPPQQLHSFDLEARFTDMGYELFNDRAKMSPARFFSGDVLAAPGSEEAGGLDALVGGMDCVFASSFLHVWDWEDMVRATKRLVAFTRARGGSVVAGRQLGSTVAGSRAMPTQSGPNYRHDVESLGRFWEQVGRETGSEWEVEAGLYEGQKELGANRNVSWAEPNMCMLWFTATRL